MWVSESPEKHAGQDRDQVRMAAIEGDGSEECGRWQGLVEG